jgi:hypothetical protein
MNQYIPQADVRVCLVRLRGVQGASQVVPYVAGYADQLTYSVDLFDELGRTRSIDGVKPVGQRWQRPFMVRPPNMAPDTETFINYEAYTFGIVFNQTLFVFVNEVPDYAPCQTDDTPPTDDVPGGSGDGPPIIVPRPIQPRGLGLLSRIMLNSSPAELKALAAAIDAVRESA